MFGQQTTIAQPRDSPTVTNQPAERVTVVDICVKARCLLANRRSTKPLCFLSSKKTEVEKINLYLTYLGVHCSGMYKLYKRRFNKFQEPEVHKFLSMHKMQTLKLQF